MSVIGFVGFISAGKDTAADYFINFHEYRRDSFASSLKDALASIFGWDRIMLEGRSAAARAWRDQVDPWWSARLKTPHLSPRWVMQHWGTEVCRAAFHDDIWIASLENRLRLGTDNVVISDVRFPNEIAAIHRAGGKVVRIVRGPDPAWFETAKLANAGSASALLEMQLLGIHKSEWAWAGGCIDLEVDNNGTVDALFQQLKDLESSLPAAKVI